MFRLYYEVLGGHTHVRVFCNGKCGDLVFLNEEWEEFRKQLGPKVQVLPEHTGSQQ